MFRNSKSAAILTGVLVAAATILPLRAENPREPATEPVELMKAFKAGSIRLELTAKDGGKSVDLKVENLTESPIVVLIVKGKTPIDISMVHRRVFLIASDPQTLPLPKAASATVTLPLEQEGAGTWSSGTVGMRITPPAPKKSDAARSGETWTGATSQGKKFSFVVAGNAVTQVKLDWQIHFDKPCPTPSNSSITTLTRGGETQLSFYEGSPGSEPPRIVNGAWRLEQDPMTGLTDVSLAITAKLDESEASGDLAMKVSGDCKGESKDTWKASLKKK